MRWGYSITMKSGSMYFGSVMFFKHLIYIGLVAVTLAGFYGVYLLVDNISVGNINNWIDSAKAMAQIQTSQGNRLDTQADPYTERNMAPFRLHQKGAINGQTDLSDDMATVDESEGSNNSDNTKTDYQFKKTNLSIDYQFKYPELYCDPADDFIYREKIAYLTFDDGPSSRTLEILDILKEYNIKATFFVITHNTNTSILKRIAEEGHAIGIHTNSHKYREIYNSVEAFLDDFNAAYQKIYEETAIKPEIFRFPGGSLNAYNMGTYQEIISEMLRRGFLYYDWNISTNDTNLKISAQEIINNIKESVKGQNKLVILSHDSEHKYETVKALPEIIEFLKNEGYSFDKLDNSVEPIIFSYR